MRFIFIPAGVLALAMTAVTLSAQTASPPVTTPVPIPYLAELTQYLSLSDSQVTSLQNIVQQKIQAQQQVGEQISQKYQALAALLESANPNPTTVGQTLIDIQNLQKQLNPGPEPYHTQALAVLNSSQATLLGNLNTALQLEATAYQAVSVNLLVLPGAGCTIASLTPVVGCPILPGGVILPPFIPGIPSLPGGVLPAIAPAKP